MIDRPRKCFDADNLFRGVKIAFISFVVSCIILDRYILCQNFRDLSLPQRQVVRGLQRPPHLQRIHLLICLRAQRMNGRTLRAVQHL